jgi:hypothetical protein
MNISMNTGEIAKIYSRKQSKQTLAKSGCRLLSGPDEHHLRNYCDVYHLFNTFVFVCESLCVMHELQNI